MTNPSDEMLAQRQLRAAEIALETARRRRLETDRELVALEDELEEAETALAESETAQARLREAVAEQIRLAKVAQTTAEQRYIEERGRRLDLEQQLSALRRDERRRDDLSRQLAAEERVRQLEGELEVVIAQAAAFEQGIRRAALDALTEMRQTSGRVSDLLIAAGLDDAPPRPRRRAAAAGAPTPVLPAAPLPVSAAPPAPTPPAPPSIPAAVATPAGVAPVELPTRPQIAGPGSLPRAGVAPPVPAPPRVEEIVSIFELSPEVGAATVTDRLAESLVPVTETEPEGASRQPAPSSFVPPPTTTFVRTLPPPSAPSIAASLEPDPEPEPAEATPSVVRRIADGSGPSLIRRVAVGRRHSREEAALETEATPAEPTAPPLPDHPPIREDLAPMPVADLLPSSRLDAALDRLKSAAPAPEDEQ